MLKEYNVLREQGLELANVAMVRQELMDLVDSSGLRDDLFSLERGAFQIAVIAPFSAGKSTFINALMGTDLLSMSILAETAIVTRIRWGATPRLTVQYHGGTTESLPGGGASLSTSDIKELLRLITTVVRSEEQETLIRAHLHEFAKAPGETAEAKIREVILDWPLPLCEGGVEVIDTPGLFSRHEKHGDITGRILPTVQAVVFLLEPTQIGQEGFTEVIRQYTREAQASNLKEASNRSRHIFFLLNKVDRIRDEVEYTEAIDEIRRALRGIVDQPQILSVSAFFALMARRVLSGELSLKDLAKEKAVVIPDPEEPDMPLYARHFEERHLPILLQTSRIQDVELALGRYLQGRNLYLLENLARTLFGVWSRAEESAVKKEQMAQQISGEKQEEYQERIKVAQHQIREMEGGALSSVQRIVKTGLTVNKRGSLVYRLDHELEALQGDVSAKVRNALQKAWQAVRPSVSPDNASARMEAVGNKATQAAQLELKEATRSLFEMVNESVTQAAQELKGLFADQRMDADTLIAKALGTEQGLTGEINIENLIQSVMREVEQHFQQQAMQIAEGVQGTIHEAKSRATSYERAPGLWNWISSLWSGHERIEKFNPAQFRAGLDEVIETFGTRYESYIYDAVIRLSSDLRDRLVQIAKQMTQQAEKLFTFEIQALHRHLEGLQDELKRHAQDLKQMATQQRELMQQYRTYAAMARAFMQECQQLGGVA